MELLVTVIEVVVLGPVCSQISPGPDIPSQTILGGLRNMREDQSEAEVEVEDVFPPALVALSSLSHMSKSTDQNSECLKRASSRSLEALE